MLAGATAFGAAWFATSTIDVPLAWFDPVARVWSFGHRPGSVAIDWYGRTLYSLAAGAVFFLAARVFSKRREPSEAGVRLWLVWAGFALLLSASLYGAALWNRRAPPEPLPSWYVPR